MGKRQTPKNGDKRVKFRIKYARKHRIISFRGKREERMSQTHTGDITKAAKKVAKWCQAKKITRGEDITARVTSHFPQFVGDDQRAVVMGALALWKRTGDETYDRFIEERGRG